MHTYTHYHTCAAECRPSLFLETDLFLCLAFYYKLFAIHINVSAILFYKLKTFAILHYVESLLCIFHILLWVGWIHLAVWCIFTIAKWDLCWCPCSCHETHPFCLVECLLTTLSKGVSLWWEYFWVSHRLSLDSFPNLTQFQLGHFHIYLSPIHFESV